MASVKTAAVFVDANPALAALAERLRRADDPPLTVNRNPEISPDALPQVLDGAAIAIIDHTYLTVLTTLSNVTLSAHSAFRTPEASENLIEAALEHCRRIARSGS
jgi:phosphoglycerate dehydrogenase-like enzyme